MELMEEFILVKERCGKRIPIQDDERTGDNLLLLSPYPFEFSPDNATYILCGIPVSLT